MVDNPNPSIQKKLEQLAAAFPELKQNDLWHALEQEVSQALPASNGESASLKKTELFQGGQAIVNAFSEQQIFAALLEQLQTADPCEIVAFRFDLVDNQPVWAKLKQVWQTKDNPTYPSGQKFYLPETLHATLLTREDPLFVADIAASPHISAADREGLIPTGAQAVAVLPLNYLGHQLGVVNIYFTSPHPFSEATQRLWTALAQQASLALSQRQLTQESAFRVIQMETAADVARQASSLLDLADLLNAVVALIRDRFELYYVGVFLVDETERWAYLKAGTGQAGQKQLQDQHRLKISDDSLLGRCLQQRHAQIALDVGPQATEFKDPYLPHTRSQLALPLISQQEIIGGLALHSKEQAAFDQTDIIFLQTMADQLTNGIQNARLYAQAQQEIAERRRMEKELRANETKYRDLVESANSIIFKMDTSGRVTSFNEYAQNFFGYSEEEILGQHVVGTIVPQTDNAGHDLAQMIEGIIHHPEQYATNENENMRRSGERVWVSWTNKAIHNEAGQFVEVLCIGQDATTRKKAQEEIRKLSTAVEQSPSITLITDAEGAIEYVNPKFAQVTGYSLAEIKGKNPRILQSGKMSQEDYKEMWDTIIAGQEWSGEFYNKKKNGEFYWAAATISPLKNDAGKITHFLSVQEDITERKQTEKALQESEERYRALYTKTPAMLYSIDEQGQIVDVSNTWLKVLGYERDEVIGRTTTDFLTKASRLYAENVALPTLKKADQVRDIQFQFIKKNGDIIDVLLSAMVERDAAGEFVRSLAILTDITERKQAEEALRISEERRAMATSAGKVGVWDWDLQTDEIYLDPDLKAILGYEDDEISNQLEDWASHVHPADAEMVMAAAQAHLEGKTPHYELEHRMLHKDGSVRWILVRGTAYRDDSGQPYRMIGTDTDITELKQAQKALEESEERFRRLIQDLHIGVLLQGPEAEMLMSNPAVQELLGLTADQLSGKTPTEPDWNVIREDGTPFPETERPVPQAIAAGQPVRNVVMGVYRPQTEDRVWLLVDAHPQLDEAGQVQQVVCTFNDITQRKQAEQTLARRERYLATQLEIQNILLASKGNTSPYTPVLKKLGEVSGASRVYVFENHRDASDRLLTSQKAEWCGPGATPEIDNPELQNLAYGEVLPRWAKILGQGDFITGQISDFPQPEREILEPQGILAILVLPLTVRGEFFGFIGFDNCQDDEPWSSSEVDLLSTAAAAVSLWHERRRAEEGLLQALQRTESLYRIGDAMATATDQAATFQTVLAEYLRLLGQQPPRGSLALFDPAHSVCRIKTLHLEGQTIKTDLSFSLAEEPLARQLLENPKPLLIEDVHQHPLTAENPASWNYLGQITSLLCVPLLIQGQPVGAILAASDQKGEVFSPSDIELGQVIADQLAIWLENRRLLSESQYRSNRLQTAAEVSRAASSILDMDALIDTSVNLIRDQFNFYYVGLFLLDEAREWAVLRAGTGQAGRIQLERNHKLKIGGESMIGWSVANRQPRIALDVGEEAVHFRNPILPDTHSEMALPLISRDEVLGALTVQSVERGAFSDEDITLLQTMADQLANALKNASLFESAAQTRQEAEARLQETLALQELSRNLAGTLQTEEITQAFFNACTEVLGFDFVIFSLVDDKRERVRAIAGAGVTDTHLELANHPLDSNDIMADTVNTGQTEIISGWDERFDPKIFEGEGHAEWGTRIFTPITLRQEHIGLVEVGFNKNIQADVNESQIRLLKAFINQTALALDNARRYQTSRRAARREALIKEITTKVRASTNLDTILKTTVKEVGEAIGGKRAYIHLLPQQKKTKGQPNGDDEAKHNGGSGQ